MAVKAVTFDAYGTLLRNEDLMRIPRRMVADHGLATRVEDVWRAWIDLYFEATRVLPFRTLRQIQTDILSQVLRQLGVAADPAPYVDLYFKVTTSVELYPEALGVLNTLGPIRAVVVSNADHEHLAAWNFKWPVQHVVISEAVRAYKPNPLPFQTALAALGLEPDDVLHVGDSEVDDVQGARAAGLRVAWLNRSGRPRRADLPAADFEIRDLTALIGIIL